jgi:hypothetical protein
MATSSQRTLKADFIEGILSQKNYIRNSGAKDNTLGYSAYADAAGSQPVDATGGSPTVTITRSTSSPLSGDASLLFTKDAANRQGEGFSYDFEIDKADEGKVFTVSLDYAVASGTYSGGSSSADSDLTVYIISKEFGTVIQPSFYKLQGAVVDSSYHATCTFQPPVSAGGGSARQFRLAFHVATTSASAYTVKFDNISVSPVAMGTIPIQADWTNVTNSVTVSSGFGTVTNKEIFMRRDGDTMLLRGTFRSGTVTGSSAYIELPFGLKADSSKTNWGIAFASLGRWQTSTLATTAFSVDGSLANIQGMCTAYDSNPERLVFAFRGTTYGFQNPSVSSIMAGGEAFSFEATIPIQGWGSSVAVSPDTTSGRLVMAKYYHSAGTTLNSDDIINFNSKVNDTHAAVTVGSNWKFVAPEPGSYKIEAYIESQATSVSAGTRWNLQLFKNGSFHEQKGRSDVEVTATQFRSLTGLFEIDLVAGDYIDVRFNSNGGGFPLLGADGYSSIVITKLSNQAQIGPGEEISARAYTATAGSYSAGDNIVWDGKSYDTHNALNISTGKFTAPAPGRYRVKAQIRFQSASNTQGDTPSFILEKNDADYAFIDNYLIPYTGSFVLFFSGDATVELNAGDTCNVYAAGYGGTRGLTTNAGINYIEIERIG